MPPPLNPNHPYGIWWTPGEIAQADERIRTFTEAAVSHREKCPTCLSRQPCDSLHNAIDRIQAEIREIGDKAYTRYVQNAEAKYAHRNYRSP